MRERERLLLLIFIVENKHFKYNEKIKMVYANKYI
jgi:hypothetical protein